MKRTFPYSALLLVLLAGNSLLSYARFSALSIGWIFSLGVLAPWIVLFLEEAPSKGEERSAGVRGMEEGSGAEFWVLGLMVAGLLPRFWRLTEGFLWPTGDEGLHGFLALELSRHWTDQFFYTVGEHPPLLIWSLALLFKAGMGSFAALWSLPAFFSSLLVPLGYVTARLWFDRRWSLVFTVLMALSYWPLAFGRYCHQGLFVPFWELVAFWGMGKVTRMTNGRRKPWGSLLLGLWIGWGTLTFTAWWAVMAGFTVVFFWFEWGRRRVERSFYGMGLLLGLAPFLGAAFHEGYGHHLLDSSFMNQGFDQAHLWVTRISYITSLFWGSLQAGTSYGPLWGGMLNPILATAFGAGLVTLIHRRREGWAQGLLFALVISLLPGVLAGDYVELNRIIQVMPWVLLTCVVGFRSFFSRVGAGKGSRAVLLVTLALSCSLDGWHYLKPILPGEMARFGKGVSLSVGAELDFQTYQTLEKMAASQGPGLILTDLLPLKYGHTLSVAVHPFNAAENDRLDPTGCRWAALLTQVHYVPFLKSRFPQAQWYWFGPTPPSLQGGMAFGVIPLGGKDRTWASNWLSVQHSFHRLNLEAERSFNGPRYFQEALADTWGLYPQVQGDRYLEAVYWEWVSQFYFGDDPSIPLRILHNAVERGLPAAHLLEALSVRSSQAHLEVQAARFHALALKAAQESPWN